MQLRVLEGRERRADAVSVILTEGEESSIKEGMGVGAEGDASPHVITLAIDVPLEIGNLKHCQARFPVNRAPAFVCLQHLRPEFPPTLPTLPIGNNGLTRCPSLYGNELERGRAVALVARASVRIFGDSVHQNSEVADPVPQTVAPPGVRRRHIFSADALAPSADFPNRRFDEEMNAFAWLQRAKSPRHRPPEVDFPWFAVHLRN